MAQGKQRKPGEPARPRARSGDTDCPLAGGPGGPCGPQSPRCLSGAARNVAESLLPTHDDQAMIVAPCGMVLMVNHAMARRLGLDRDEVAGRRLDDLHPPHVAAGRRAVLDVVVSSGNPVQFQETTDERIMQVRFVPVREEGGRTGGVFVQEIDVTDHKKRDMEKLWLGTAIEQAAEAIIIMDEDFAIQYVNQAFEAMTGYSREEMRHRSMETLYAGDVQQEQFRLVAETLSQGDVWTGRTLNRRKDNSVFRCEKTVSPIRGRHGVHLGYVSVWRDVTQEVELERQLRHAQKMEAIGTLAGGIAHDFNNILGPIILHAELVLETLKANRTARASLREILKAAGRARDLIDQILNLSRQRETDEPVPFRLGSIVKECVKLLRPTLPTSIEITVDIGSSEDMILADPTQIHQVIMNLCTNAAHAMRQAGGRLGLEVRDLELGRGTEHEFPVEHYGTFLALTVRDTGHGMTPEFAEKIFDPFFTTKQDGMGTGLGLTVVHNIVARLGGLIRVESGIGQGSAFHVLLPKSPRPAREAEARPVSPDLRGRERILLVDDQPLMLSGARAVLEGLGYSVEGCLSATQAMEAFRGNPHGFDLVVADLTMPDMTGLDLSRELLQVRPDLPVILSSGYGGLLSADLVRGAGIREFVRKPYSTEEMASAVRRALDA